MLYSKHVRKLSNDLRSLDGEAQAFAQARLTHLRTVRAFANETLEAQRFREVSTSYTVYSTSVPPCMLPVWFGRAHGNVLYCNVM